MTATAVAGAGLVDLLPDAVFEVDAECRVVLANSAAQRLTGFPASMLCGALLPEVLHLRGRDGRPVWQGRWHPSAGLSSARGLAEQQVTMRRAGGQDMRALLTGTYLRGPGGELSGALLCLRDPARGEHQAAAGIEIVSTVSHELRSPLTSVKGYTSLLLNRWDRLKDEDKRMMLEHVQHDADRVTRLITELLDISRLETGRLALRPHAVDLAALSAVVVDKVRLEYPELEVSLRYPEGFPRAWADADKIEQVLTNLVENACKYGSPRGISVEGTASEGDVSVTVTDQGPGIPPADLPKVFTKFFRRSEGRPTGSGLGLWISRGLVEAHGGNLVARSEPGAGTSFTFTLPRADQQAVFTA